MAAAFGALACWTLGPILIKYLAGHVDFWTQNVYRYLVASLFWLPVLVFSARKGTIHAGLWKRALVPAGCNVVMQSFWALAFYHLNPAFVILLSQSSALWIALLSVALFPEERRFARRPLFLCGMVLAFASVTGVILARPDFKAEGTILGIVCVLCSSVAWALYAVSARIAFRGASSNVGFAITCNYTFVGLAVLAAIYSHPLRGLPVSFSFWGILVGSAVVAIALAHVFYYASMKRIGSTIPAVLLLALPFTVLLVSSAVFDEHLSPAQWTWGSLLIVGSGLATLSRRRTLPSRKEPRL